MESRLLLQTVISYPYCLDPGVNKSAEKIHHSRVLSPVTSNTVAYTGSYRQDPTERILQRGSYREDYVDKIRQTGFYRQDQINLIQKMGSYRQDPTNRIL